MREKERQRERQRDRERQRERQNVFESTSVIKEKSCFPEHYPIQNGGGCSLPEIKYQSTNTLSCYI